MHWHSNKQNVKKPNWKLWIACFSTAKGFHVIKKALIIFDYFIHHSITKPPTKNHTFLKRWGISTLYRSIDLSRQLEFRKRAHYWMYSLKVFLNTNVVSFYFLGKINHTWYFSILIYRIVILVVSIQ